MRAAAATQHIATISDAIVAATREEIVAKTVVASAKDAKTAVAKRLTAIATARAALQNVAIAMGQMERATMASAATDRRMQPRVQKIRAEIGASGALTEKTAATASASALGNVAI